MERKRKPTRLACLGLILAASLCQASFADDTISSSAESQPSKPANDDTSARLKKLLDFMEQYPPKLMVISPDRSMKPLLIAANMFTTNPQFGVLAIEASQGTPTKLWVYGDKVYDVNCQVQDHFNDEDIKTASIEILSHFTGAVAQNLQPVIQTKLLHIYRCKISPPPETGRTSGLTTSSSGAVMISYSDSSKHPNFASFVDVLDKDNYTVYHFEGSIEVPQ